jgi:hypothetical protein
MFDHVGIDVFNGTDWVNIWANDVDGLQEIEWTYKEFDVSSYAAGNANFQIRFYYGTSDESVQYSGWAIDDIVINFPEQHDLGILEVNPSTIVTGEDIIPSVTVKNFGVNDEISYDVNLVIPDLSYDETVTVTNSISVGTTANIEMPIILSPLSGIYPATVTVTLIDDSNFDNDIYYLDFNVIETFDAYVINFGDGTTGSFASLSIPVGVETEISTYSVGSNFPTAMEFAENTYYIVKTYPAELYTIDPLTGTDNLVGAITGMSGFPTGIAYDWENGVMYIMMIDDSDLPHLGTINLTTAVATEIGVGSGMIIAIEFDNDGNLYGPTLDTDFLLSINTADGSTTEIGPVGIGLNYGQDMSYDKNSGIMYTICSGDYYGLCTINLSTGAYTKVVDFYDVQYPCFAIPWGFVKNNDNQINENISIYPNPSNGIVNIFVVETSVVSILDVAGRLIDTYNVNSNSSINLNQPAGLYFVRVETNGEIATHKLVIQ